MESVDCSAKNKAVSVVPLEVEVQAIQLKDIKKVLGFPRICYQIANQTEGDIFKKATGYYKNLQENKTKLRDCCETLMSTIAIHLAVDGIPKYIYKMSNVDASYEDYAALYEVAKEIIDEIENSREEEDSRIKALFKGKGVSQFRSTASSGNQVVGEQIFWKTLLANTGIGTREQERENEEREKEIKKIKKETCEELCW